MSQNKAFSTPFILAVLCIYFSYFLHGISVITLAQNMSSLAEKFSTDNAGIALFNFRYRFGTIDQYFILRCDLR